MQVLFLLHDDVADPGGALSLGLGGHRVLLVVSNTCQLLLQLRVQVVGEGVSVVGAYLPLHF